VSFGMWKVMGTCVTSSFRREMDKNCALLGHYAASSSKFSLTSRDNLSVPTPEVNNPEFLTLKMVPISGPETSVRNYNFLLCNDTEEDRSPRNFIALKNVPIFLKEI